MMKLEMATSLRPSALEVALQDPTLNVLLIDCRSFMDFNSCHIANAHNVHFPPIVKRRSGGTIPLENIIRCAKTRGLLFGGQYSQVVLYDEDSRSLDDLPSDSVMYLVLKSLTDESDLQPLYFVEGKCSHQRERKKVNIIVCVLPLLVLNYSSGSRLWSPVTEQMGRDWLRVAQPHQHE